MLVGQQEVERALDRGERRPQLVGDGGDELGLHAVDLALAGDVAQGDRDPDHAAQEIVGGRDHPAERPPLGSRELEVAVGGLRRAPERGGQRGAARRLPVDRGRERLHQMREGTPDHRAWLDPEQGAAPLVERHHRPVEVEHQEAVGGRGEDLLELGLLVLRVLEEGRVVERHRELVRVRGEEARLGLGERARPRELEEETAEHPAPAAHRKAGEPPARLDETGPEQVRAGRGVGDEQRGLAAPQGLGQRAHRVAGPVAPRDGLGRGRRRAPRTARCRRGSPRRSARASPPRSGSRRLTSSVRWSVRAAALSSAAPARFFWVAE